MAFQHYFSYCFTALVKEAIKVAEVPTSPTVPAKEPNNDKPNATQPLKEEPKLPEANIPIKKYYGRRRDDQSSSEDHTSVDEDDSNDKDK